MVSVMGPFEVFDTSSARADLESGLPTIHAVSEGRLRLNAAAARLLGNTAWVQLLWDDETKRIGIRPATESTDSALRVTRGTSQATITSKAFVTTYKLLYKKRMRLAWDGTMWVASTVHPDDPLRQDDPNSRIPRRIR
jgi:hypothetical protein